ncbi:MAG: ATP-binding cassette domain-containing protein [Rickettsiales bacterium]
MTLPLLRIEGLTVDLVASDRQKRAVDAVSLTVGEDDVVALVGESGSGKSVTAHAVLKLLPDSLRVTAGKIFLGDLDVLGASEKTMRDVRGSKVGMIFQEPMSALNPLHSVYKQIAETIALHTSGVDGKTLSDKVASLLKEVRLDALIENARDIYPHRLSGGQRQRVMIAMALANDPSLLIADEPTTALDVTTQKAIFELLEEIRRRRRMGVLLITHDLALTKRVAHRIYVMKQGAVVESGDAAQVMEHPSHDYTKELLEGRSLSRKRTEIETKNAPVCVSLKNASAGYEHKKFFSGSVEYKVNGLNLELRRGETVGVVGESGSGKTTMAMAMLGLIPTKGEWRVGDTLLPEAPSGRASAPLRQFIHIVFQDPFSSLNPRMTVREILSEGPRATGCKKRLKDEYLEELLDSVRMNKNALERYPHSFSGGQRQRIAIARALAMEPHALILDEPTSALDVSTQKKLLNLLLRLQRERSMAYVLISHDMHVVGALSDKIVVLKDGEAVECGTADAVLTRPTHPYSKELLEAALAA